MFVKDETILAPDETGRTRINWNEWHGDKVIYRRVSAQSDQLAAASGNCGPA